MLFNGSGAKPMIAFCSFPKTATIRGRSTIEFQCHRALFGVCLDDSHVHTFWMNLCYFRVPLWFAKATKYIHLHCSTSTASCRGDLPVSAEAAMPLLLRA